MPAPERLRPDNFTPLSRTPWAGSRLVARYKPDLAARPVGESWEISVDPAFPSRLERDGTRLADLVAAAPEAWLGPAIARRFGGQSPLLVKLLDSAENLSVQVHPADDDPDLGPGEGGKPEGWYVLDAEPGAGLYLGFRDGVDRATIERCLRSAENLEKHLNFVPVSPGDAFVIEPGTVHAIGAGVTLAEPQHVRPGREGVTYRFWDWDRRYDAHGRPDPGGRPRPLHIDRSLAVAAWSAPRGEAFVRACRGAPRILDSGPLGRTLALDTAHFAAELWSGTGELHLATPTLIGVTSLSGAVTLRTEEGEVHLPPGRSAVVPAVAGRVAITGRASRALACFTNPGAPSGGLEACRPELRRQEESPPQDLDAASWTRSPRDAMVILPVPGTFHGAARSTSTAGSSTLRREQGGATPREGGRTSRCSIGRARAFSGPGWWRWCWRRSARRRPSRRLRAGT